MCLAVWSIAQSARFPWVVASNRDEFHDRPSAPLAWWRPDGADADVLSGRDLAAGGTWLGLDRQGRLALLTNVREPGRFDPAAASRGALVLQGLQRGPQDGAWIAALSQQPRNGYNLMLADLRAESAVWTSNRAVRPVTMGTGLHGLSNALLDTPWPKVVALKQRLADAVMQAGDVETLVDAALHALVQREIAPDAALPRTGVPLARERELAPAFIRMAVDDGGRPRAYGTRCSTVVVVERQGPRRRVHVVERRYDAAGGETGCSREVFEFAGEPPADSVVDRRS